MNPIPKDDSLHVQAARGWLELGDSAEAAAELDCISPGYREHPEVLEVEFMVGVKQRHWSLCESIGETLMRLSPDAPAGSIHFANALYFQKRYREAYDFLLPYLEKFPASAFMRFQMASFASKLGNFIEASDWLERIFSLADLDQIRAMALEDPDAESFNRPSTVAVSGIC